jgi:hypothetical protein
MVQSGNASGRVDEFGVFVLNPILALTLRIDQERVSTGIGHHDTVLDGEVILGKSLDVPFAHSGVIDQEGGQFEGGGDWDTFLLHVSDEILILEEDTELGVERSAIGNEGGSQGTVTNQSALLLTDFGGELGPSVSFVSKRRNKGSGSVDFLLGLGSLVLEDLLLAHLLSELLVQLSHLSLDLKEFALRLLQLRVSHFQLTFLHHEESLFGLHDLGLLVIFVNSEGPTHDTGGSLRHLFTSFFSEPVFLLTHVRFQKFDGLLGNLILFETDQVLHEIHIGKTGLSSFFIRVL